MLPLDTTRREGSLSMDLYLQNICQPLRCPKSTSSTTVRTIQSIIQNPSSLILQARNYGNLVPNIRTLYTNMTTFTDLNPPPAVRLREPDGCPAVSLKPEPSHLPIGSTEAQSSMPTTTVQRTARTDEMKYGPANPCIASENPTYDNGMTVRAWRAWSVSASGRY